MSPGSLEIGRDSPVRFDSSQAVAPFQQGPLAPRSDDSRACGHRQHQKMHIQPSLAKSRPRVFGCVPSAAHISRSVKAQRGPVVESIRRSGNRPEKQVGSSEQGEAFPLFISSANGRCSRGAYFGHFTRDPSPKRDGCWAGLFLDERASEDIFYDNARAFYPCGRARAACGADARRRKMPAIRRPIGDHLGDAIRQPMTFVRPQGGNGKPALLFLQNSGNFADYASCPIVFQRKV